MIFQKGIKAIVSAYRKGKVTKSRLEYSVKKILRAKYKVGLADYKPVNLLKLIPGPKYR